MPNKSDGGVTTKVKCPQIFFRLSRWENLGHFSERHLPSVSELNLETLLEQGKHDTR